MVIGSISRDFKVNAEVLPAIGGTVCGGRFSISFGEKIADQAIATTRLCAEVHMFGTVGNDIFAEKLIGNLTENGINATMLQVILKWNLAQSRLRSIKMTMRLFTMRSQMTRQRL